MCFRSPLFKNFTKWVVSFKVWEPLWHGQFYAVNVPVLYMVQNNIM